MFRSQSQPLLDKDSEKTEKVFSSHLHTPIEGFLINPKKTKSTTDLNFFVLGCIGSASDRQRQVSLLMDQIAQQKIPDFIVLLGDQFYDSGVGQPNDPAFKVGFYDMYAELLKKDIPFFVIAGNHCHNLTTAFLGSKGGNINYKLISAQIEHTYLNENANSIYQRPVIDLGTLSGWNMPSRYYYFRYHGIELFFIDSNTYVKEFLSGTGQAEWLKQKASANDDTIKLLFMHTAPVTVGKRAYHPDTRIFLNECDVQTLKELGITGSYNDMLKQVLGEMQDLTFDAIFAAHDHDICLQRMDDTMVAISGGGGGKLQDRRYFGNWKDISCFIKDFGFISADIKTLNHEIQLDYFYGPVESYQHLRFNNFQDEPIQAVNESVSKIDLRPMVLKAYEDYCNFLHENQTRSWGSFFMMNLSHGSEGAKRADDVRNFFNQYHPPEFKEAMLYLQSQYPKGFKQILQGYFPSLIHEHAENSFFNYLRYYINPYLEKYQQEFQAYLYAPDHELVTPRPIQSVSSSSMSTSLDERPVSPRFSPTFSLFKAEEEAITAEEESKLPLPLTPR